MARWLEGCEEGRRLDGARVLLQLERTVTERMGVSLGALLQVPKNS
jgi:hypothetical protein